MNHISTDLIYDSLAMSTDIITRQTSGKVPTLLFEFSALDSNNQITSFLPSGTLAI